MKREIFDVGAYVVRQVFGNTLAPTSVRRVCMFMYENWAHKMSCVHRSSCPLHSHGADLANDDASRTRCTVVEELFRTYKISELLARPKVIHSSDINHSRGSQITIPVTDEGNAPIGLLVFESERPQKLTFEQVEIAQLVGRFCLQMLQKSRQLPYSSRMVSKFKLLSDTSDVLLSHSEYRPLSEKLEYVVERTLDIIDAEYCSLWLPKDGNIHLEVSYSSSGKIKKDLSWPIVDKPRSGMTGSIAFRKQVFNAFGDEIDNYPARNPDNPVDFVVSDKIYSELAYPMLSREGDLLGLLIAYNKKDSRGKPYMDKGFSKEFDEPLMKILTTKIAILLTNTAPLRNLHGYQRIVESTPDPVMITNKRGIITYMNPGARSLFGNLDGHPVAEHFPSDEKSSGLQKAREIMRLLRKNKQGRLTNFETEFKAEDGEIIVISLSLSILRDENGKEVAVAGIAKDLRGIKALLASGQSLLDTYDIEEILHRITQTCLRLKNTLRAYIKQYDEASSRLVFKALNSKKKHETFPVASTPLEHGMTGYVFRTQQPHLSKDVAAEPEGRYVPLFDHVKSKIVVPITAVDKESSATRRLGIISVDSDRVDAFSSNELYFLSNLANQAAVALQNATLITSKNDVIKQLRAVYLVQQSTSGKNPDVNKIYDAILNAVVDVLGYKYANISAVDKASNTIATIKCKNVDPEFPAQACHSLDSKDIQAWVWRRHEHVYLDGWDERLDRKIFERFGHDKLVRVIIPIIARGDVLGTLEAGHDKSERTEITEEEIATLQQLVNLAGVGIEQAHLVKRMKEDLSLRSILEKQLDALNQSSIEILNSTTEDDVFQHVFTSLENIGYGKGMISVVIDEAKQIVAKHARGNNWEKIVESKLSFGLTGNNILAQSLRSGQAIHSKNCYRDHRWNKKLAREAKIKAQYVLPLIVKRKPIGTLQVDLTDRSDLFEYDESLFERRMKVLETFASQSAIAIRNVRDMVTIDRLEENIAETAHEFRSPLHNIMTQLGGLKHTLAQNREEDIGRFLSIIEEQIYRADRQVNNSLLASMRTTIEFDFAEGHIQKVIKSCVDTYRLRALERGISIIVRDKVKSLPPIVFDHCKVEQALTNLIDNAVKYSHANQFITIIGFDDGTNINIEISDQGLGIPESEFGSIFKGFTRSDVKDKIRYIPGTGIGLKICKEIVKGHGGEVLVSSKPLFPDSQKNKEYQNYKTTFKVRLPKKQKGVHR